MGCIVQVDNGAAAPSSAAPSTGVTNAIPGEPISLLLKESVIVILQKDGGVDNMEVQGTIALQVTPYKPSCVASGLKCACSILGVCCHAEQAAVSIAPGHGGAT